MNQRHKSALLRTQSKLVQNLEIKGEFLDLVIEANIFTDEMMEDIKAGRTRSAGVRQLLYLLQGRSPDAYLTFLHCLRNSGHSFLADAVVNEELQLTDAAVTDTSVSGPKGGSDGKVESDTRKRPFQNTTDGNIQSSTKRRASPLSGAKSDTESAPFVFTKRNKNMKVCRGCRQKFPKQICAPDDYLLQHKEIYTFNKTLRETQEAYGNRYYHVSAQCLKAKYPNLSLSKDMVVIPPGVMFTAEHISYFKRNNVDVDDIADKSLLN